MKGFYSLCVIIFTTLTLANEVHAQRGYFDAPYVRYEADSGNLVNATVTARSYAQTNLQSEASGQVCVNLPAAGASVDWTVSADGDGLVVRYSVPSGQSGTLDVYADGVLAGSLNLTTYYSWELLGTIDPNIPNKNPKMRFDEVRLKLPSKILKGGNLKLVNKTGNIHIDFVELESVPAEVTAATGDVTYTGNGSTLQAFIDANGGKTIYLPSGVYSVNTELYLGVSNTKIKGAGMWYTQINFTNINGGKGGLRANASNIGLSGLYLTTVRNARAGSYKAINGVYTSGSVITNIWAEHFECGAWIAQYNAGTITKADGFTLSHCRFRNNYADGINLCKGTSNAIVEHCNFRNNGDDDMAIWSANGLECQNNTFRYNTSEHCWRSAGCAIYGGLNNTAHHLLIRDNVEVGIKVNNDFTGVGFNKNGMHVFSDITIIGCGTFNDIFNGTVGAIDVACNSVAGTRINNVKFSNIDIIDSKNDAIYIYKKNGEGFYNLVFENIKVNGTGKEYPDNNFKGLNWGRGYGLIFVGKPAGYGTYCNITYSDRGGNATTNVLSDQIGTFSWTADCSPPTPTTITSPATFGICNSAVTFAATTAVPTDSTVSYIEFLVDNSSIGKDNLAPYSLDWASPVSGNHQVKAAAHYTGGGSSTGAVQNISVEEGIFSTSSAPVIDGYIDTVWNKYAPFPIDKISVGSFTNAADLTATYKVTRDAANLYILVDVTDDVLKNNNTKDHWQNDAVELFIDMGNDKGGSYVANNDFQFNFVWGITTAQAGITFAQTTKANSLGYVLEVKIPWTTLGGVPASGSFMGIDVQVDDNDTGVRNGKKAWTDNTDNAWQSTSVLGTLQIAGCNNPYVPSAISSIEKEIKGFNFYPNPFSDAGNLSLSSGHGAFSVRIMDITGKIILEKTLQGNKTYTLGEDLTPGMYIIEVSDGITKDAAKLIKF